MAIAKRVSLELQRSLNVAAPTKDRLDEDGTLTVEIGDLNLSFLSAADVPEPIRSLDPIETTKTSFTPRGRPTSGFRIET